jgi:hypothetical protein
MTLSSQSNSHDLIRPVHFVADGLIPITIGIFFNDLLGLTRKLS